MSNETSTPAKRQAVRDRIAKQGNPFRSKLLMFALAIMTVGGGLWAYAAATRPEPKIVQSHSSTTGVAGLTGSTTQTTTETTTEVEHAEPRLIDQGGPAAFRVGLSFAVGYFLAWGIRIFAKMALLFFGAIGVGLILLTHFQVMGLNWGLLQDKMEHSLAFLQGQAEHFKAFVMGYLPSAGSAVAGTVFGFRKKA